MAKKSEDSGRIRLRESVRRVSIVFPESHLRPSAEAISEIVDFITSNYVMLWGE